MSSRKFTFTIFKKLDEISFNNEDFRYIIIGEEICPKTQRNHLQGYAETWKKIGIKKFQSLFKDAGEFHVEFKKAKDDAHAIDYCRKDGKYIEHGSPTQQGERNDIKQLHNLVRQGKTDFELLQIDEYYIYKYSKYIDRLRQIYKQEQNNNILSNQLADIKLNDKQNSILYKLLPQNNRKILWVTDYKGGTGKTTLSKYLVLKHKAIEFSNAKSKDISFCYNGQPIICFDFSRTLEGLVNYDIIEQLKNGKVFSTKYQSEPKYFNIPKIVVFANFDPCLYKLSEDRWDVLIL